MGCQATRSQRADDAGDLCGVARGNERVGSRGDSQGDGRSAGALDPLSFKAADHRGTAAIFRRHYPSNPQELSLRCHWRGSPKRNCLTTGSNYWRRERDSNPRRAFDPYTLSRGAPSTTRPSLRRDQTCQGRPAVGRVIPRQWYARCRAGCGPAAKAGKNTGGNPEGKGLSGLEALRVVLLSSGPRRWVTGPLPRLADA
jgi:hypothetical protein